MNSEKDLPYVITPAAMADLKAIALQTLQRWDKKQAKHYANKLDNCFEKIAKRKAKPLKSLFLNAFHNWNL